VVSSTSRKHFTPGKDQVFILLEAGWAPGPVWTGGKPRPHRDSILDRPARSQSLYRLSYPVYKLQDIRRKIGHTTSLHGIKFHNQRTPHCGDYTTAIRCQAKVICFQRRSKSLPTTYLKMCVKWEQLGQDG
jgi:hypothetical protein